MIQQNLVESKSITEKLSGGERRIERRRGSGGGDASHIGSLEGECPYVRGEREEGGGE